MSMFRPNPILSSDSYKFSHPDQLPPGLTHGFWGIESRGGLFGNVVMAGHQAHILNKMLSPISMRDVDGAERFCAVHGEPFHRASWDRIVRVHNGYLPLRIRAVAEGTVVPVSNILTSIEPTDSEMMWLPGWFETQYLRAIWYATTVATLSYHAKRIILAALMKSSDNPLAELPFKLHDFGARGVSSAESAMLGGYGHLINFKGSDTCEAIEFTNHFYDEEMAGFSIPATEHFTICAWGKNGELAAMRKQVGNIRPGGLAACVSDTNDIFHATEHYWGDALHEEVKKSGGTLVIRPDSGKPVEVVLKCLQILDRKVGMTKNSKGYKVLPSYYRLIQGDGVNLDSIPEILEEAHRQGYSASNLAYGMGGALLQKLDRDTQKFAMKCSEVTRDGVNIPVFKSPITDPGKASKKGRQDLVRRNGRYETLQNLDAPAPDSLLNLVYENGKHFNRDNLANIRQRAEAPLLAEFGLTA
jgi:nicotinamide phosphoribosyltransferase